MRVTKEDLQCKVVLSNDDIIRYSRELSASKSKQTRMENELKSFTAMKKAEIQKEEATVLINSEKINNGYEFKDVECNVNYNWDTKIKTWIRIDTGEIEKEDIISEREYQEYLDL